jgi:succinyl-diaminopimelate desuccinylase
LTSRLVAGQNPDRCLRLIETHLLKHAPKGLRLIISERSSAGPALRLNPDSQLIARAKKALDQLDARGTVFMWEGASIPVVSALAATAGAEPLLVGFGNDRDCAHAPNESFSLEQFRRGYLYVALMLTGLV